MFNKLKFPVFLLSIIILVFSLGYTFSQNYLSPTKPKEVEARTVSIDPICMGKALADYMNAVLAETGSLSKIRPLSPAINLTHYISPNLFQEMLNNNANFGALWGFAGNTYSSLSDGTDPNGAFFWYSPWRELFNNAALGKKVVITETGDFELKITSDRPSIIADMKNEFNKFMNSTPPEVAGVLYFNAFNTNPDPNFVYAPLSGPELQNIASSSPGRAGVNSANVIGASGNFGTRVTDLGLKWSLEILTGPEQLDAAVNAVNSSSANTVLRLCLAEGGCGFGTHKNPQPLIDFLKALNGRVNKPVWVIIGPNEPENEVWVAPECAVVEEIDTEFPIPCNATTDDELHNLRPYGSNPCDGGINNLAMMCGNDLITRQEVSVDFPDGGTGCTLIHEEPNTDPDLPIPWIYRDWSCDHKRRPNPSTGEIELSTALQGTIEVKIDLTDTKFPIMGNTEIVPNREHEEGIDFAQRMNNYVSWYLHGAMFSPFESPVDYEKEDHKDVLDPDLPLEENLKTDVNNVINYAGPLNKLLSWRNLVEERNTEAEDAWASDNQNAGIRHNQIGGCIYELETPFTENPDLAPKTCFRGTNYAGIGQELKRLDTWGTSRGNPGNAPEEDYVDILNEKPLTPPYESFIDYWQDFKEWRGRICGLIEPPLIPIKLFACFDDDFLGDFLKSNVKGLLYHGIPLASTEDKKGVVLTGADPVQPSSDDGNGVSIVQIEILPDDITLDPGNPNLDKFQRNLDILYFPHMISSTEMADNLQSTFAPFSQNPLTKINGEIVTFDGIFDNGERCEVLDARVNPGDDLYGELERVDGNGNPIDPAEGNIKAKVQYTAEFTCDYREGLDVNGFTQCLTSQICAEAATCTTTLNGTVIVGPETDADPGGPLNCDEPIPSDTSIPIDRTGWVTCEYKDKSEGRVLFCIDENTTVNTCQKTVMTSTNVNVGTPYAEKAWRQLVQSDMSVFKKIYPAIGPEAPVESFLQIPAQARASYSASSLGANIATTTSPQTFAGDPQENVPGTNAKLYFPYIGGIQKYFLEGIQCALRPKGTPCELSNTGGGIGSEPTVAPEDTANCPDVSSSEIPANWQGSYKDNVIRIADGWLTDDADTHNARKCYNAVVKGALDSGVNPAFALAIWLHESDASNYKYSPLCWEDFGIHTAGVCENFTSQFSIFLDLWDDDGLKDTYPNCFGGGVPDLKAAMDIFWYGGSVCPTAGQSRQFYWDAIKGVWDLISPGCSFDSISYPPRNPECAP